MTLPIAAAAPRSLVSTPSRDTDPTTRVTDFTRPRKNECYSFEPGAEAAERALKENGTPADFMDAFPDTKWLGTLKLPDGRKLASPFLSKSDMQAVYGTGDLDYATRLTAGTGFAPVQLQAADGSKRAVFEVLTSNSKQNTLNTPYHEAAMALMVAPEEAPVVVPNVNGYSTVAASAAPGVRALSLGLVLNNQDAIDWGRKTVGLDKHPGAVTIADGEAGRSVDVQDVNGRPVYSVNDLQLTQAEMFQEAPQMAAAFGVPVEALAQLPKTVTLKHLNRDVNNGDLVETAFSTTASPAAVFNLADEGHFQKGDASTQLGGILEKGDFKPEVYWTDPNALFAYGDLKTLLPQEPPVPAA